MKVNLFAIIAASALFTATSAFTVPAPTYDHDRNANYGYDRNQRVTPQKRARYEAQHRNDHHDNDHRDDRFDRSKDYGFDRDHKATQDERRSIATATPRATA